MVSNFDDGENSLRLVGLTVVALLLFSLVALLVDSREDVLSYVGLNKNGGIEETVFATGDAPMPDSLDAAAGQVAIPILQYDAWTALAGFSSSQSFDLALPRETRFSHAVVRIDLSANLEQESAGRMKFSVNGAPRGEIILNAGESKHQVDIPLSSIDRARDRVLISVATVGNNPKAECSADWTGAVVVSILPTTRVIIGLEEPVTDLVDRLLTSGLPARIIWRDPLDGVAPEQPVELPWSWPPMATRALFVDPDNAVDTDVTATMDELFALWREQRKYQRLTEDLTAWTDVEWPVRAPFHDSGQNSREFRNRTVWNFTYDQSELPEQGLPDLFHLELTATSSNDTTGWLLLVTLNGTIVHSERVPNTTGDIVRDIALPTAVQKIRNDLRVSLTSDEEKVGRCAQGGPAAAQLKVSSYLDHEGGAVNHGYAELLSSATDSMDVYIDPNLQATGANFAFFAISQIFRDNLFAKAQPGVADQALERGLVVALGRDQLDGYLSRSESIRDEIWAAFAVITDAPKPEVFVFKADDPKLGEALEVHKPISLLLIAPAGTRI